MTVRLMSDKELARLEVLRDLDQQRLTPTAAAQLLGLERRQVSRLLKVRLIPLAPAALELEREAWLNRPGNALAPRKGAERTVHLCDRYCC